jgi:hypothetical protein
MWFNAKIPKAPRIIEKINACLTDRLPNGRGRTAVRSINLSCSRSINWLKPLAAPVTKKPPKTNKKKVVVSKV